MATQRSWQPLASRRRASEPGSEEANAAQDAGDVIEVGDLRLEVDAMRVFVRGHELGLTAQEFDMLLLLAIEQGRPVPLNKLSLAIWQNEGPEHVRHLSVLMARLRTKIAGSKTHRLETHRKRGYGLLPVTSNNKIEEIKRVKDGLDVLDDIYRHASSGVMPDADDLERMKWYGLFHRRQTPGYFMLRLRIPNGILTSEQITEIGSLSNRFGRGAIDITARQNIQLRWIELKDVPEIFGRLGAVGLEHRQSGMDNIRNITGCPMAGLDPDEVLDAAPIARALQDAIVGEHAFSNLPRKFNTSISGCRHDCATSRIHDLSLVPAMKDGRAGFNLRAGGAIGGKVPRYASDLDVFVAPERAAELCMTLIALYRDEGPREDRQKARLKVMLDGWGVERFRSELELRYGTLEHAGVDQLTSFAGDHLGVERQKQPGLNAVGCLVPVGRVTGDDLIEFGCVAQRYASSELRLTNNQNVVIVNVPGTKLAALLGEPLLQKFSPYPPNWSRRSVSCTGIDFCHFSLIDTKSAAVEFSDAMERLMPDTAQALRMHWSGCQHGCGQHQIGDLGFMASQVRIKNETVAATDVYVGGEPGAEPKLGTRIMQDVPLTELPERIAAYLRETDVARPREAVGS
jgi:ferredoxin-nitrite reductase